ncbi:hypothetical protein [Rhodoplanes roseus]|nr:hypothetical protein [Rhodoplanes roseus]
MAIIDILYSGGNVAAHADDLLEIAHLPRLAHLLTARLAEFAHLAPLRVIHIVAALTTIAIVLCVAGRIAIVSMAAAANRIGLLCGLIAGAGLVLLMAMVNLSPVGHFQVNFFFAQAVGMAAALVGLTVLQAAVWRGGQAQIAAFVAVPVWALVLAKIHLVPTLWFAASASVCALALPMSMPRRIVVGCMVGLTSATAMLIEPETRSVIQFGQTGGGDFNLLVSGARWQLNAHPIVAVSAILTLALLLIGLIFAGKRDDLTVRIRTVALLHAGAIGVVALGLAITAVLMMNNAAGYYALAKYAWIYAAELPLVVSHIAAKLGSRSQRRVRDLGLIELTIVALAFGQATAAYGWLTSQTRLIAFRDGLVQSRALLPSPPPLPAFVELTPQERYYLYISAMGQPRNAVADSILIQVAAADRIQPTDHLMRASYFSDKIETWTGEELRFGSPHSEDYLLLVGRWTGSPDGTSIVTAPAAYMAFKIPPVFGGQHLCLQMSADAAWLQSDSAAEISVNGRVVAKNGYEAERPGIMQVPLEGVRPDGDVSLFIRINRAAAPAASTAPASLAFSSMWVAPTCTVRQ